MTNEGRKDAAPPDDGRVVLLELRMAKTGGVLRGFADCLAASISLGLQSGIPLSEYTALLSHTRFEPSGWTPLGHAESITDYVGRWLATRFPDESEPTLTPRVVDGETCAKCRAPAAWSPGTACRDCGHISPPARRP